MTVYHMGKPVSSSPAPTPPSTGYLRPEVEEALPVPLLSQMMAYAMNCAFQSIDAALAEKYEDAEPMTLETFVDDFVHEFGELVRLRCGLTTITAAYLSDRESAARLFAPHQAKSQHLANAGFSVHNPIYKESNNGMSSF